METFSYIFLLIFINLLKCKTLYIDNGFRCSSTLYRDSFAVHTKESCVISVFHLLEDENYDLLGPRCVTSFLGRDGLFAIVIRLQKKRCPIRHKLKHCSSPKRRDWLWGSPSLLLIGYWKASSEVKRPRREDNHSLPTRAEKWMCGEMLSLSHAPSWRLCDRF
jgi:hypothetical protein